MNKRIILGVAGVIILLLLIIVADIGVDISVSEKDGVKIEYGSTYVKPEVKATLRGRLFHTKFKTLKVSESGSVDTSKLGTYELSYSVSDGMYKKKVKHRVHVVDTKAPVITLESEEGHYTLYGKPYEEEGYSATDNYDKDLTSKVVSREENGKVYYEVSDSSGNKGYAVRDIVYDDKTAPVIILEGEKYVMLMVGDSYKDPGFKAEDDVDGDLTSKVEVDGKVDSSNVGSYVLTYKISDAHGNVTTETRTVVVSKPSDGKLEDENTPSNKVIYLTFDDGPGPYTKKLLDILDKYNVKVTFFVTNQFPNYQNLIAEEYKRGHSVAIHTYSHKYDKVYASDAAYFEDLEKMQEVIVKQTGYRTNLVRFPGGSSNALSKKYSVGIMSRIAPELERRGYHYFDWNVSSGDAGGTKDARGVYKNVVDGCKGMKKSVVLMHDIHDYTVDAIEDIIKWGLDNGYTFLPLRENSYGSHHKISN